MNNKPKIVVTGMCDTKYTEIKYLAQEVEAAGGEVTVLNCGCGRICDWPDISLQDVLDVTARKQEEIFTMPRAEAIKAVGEAGAIKIMQMYEAGEVDGIISWAGSMGTTTVTYLMRALPFGIPKIMMTDMASSDVSMWLGNKDIYIMNPTAEQGINIVTQKMVKNAAAGVVAMAKVGEVDTSNTRPLMAITAYGTTTQTVNACSDYWSEHGWDTIIIHQVGTGATMEDLIRSGMITAIIDLTTGELTNNMYDSVYGTPDTWNGERVTAASDMGIPQIVTPGGCDQCAYGPISSMKQEYLDEYRNGTRRTWKDTGLPYIHNEGVSIMYPTLDEVRQISEYFARKLSTTTGPTAFILPMQGWSAYDQREEICSLERGWAKGNGDGPQWDPDDRHPTWSKRATLMRDILEQQLDHNNNNLDFIIADMHIVDREFADLCNCVMADMINGTFKKGAYKTYKGVV